MNTINSKHQHFCSHHTAESKKVWCTGADELRPRGRIPLCSSVSCVKTVENIYFSKNYMNFYAYFIATWILILNISFSLKLSVYGTVGDACVWDYVCCAHVSLLQHALFSPAKFYKHFRTHQRNPDNDANKLWSVRMLDKNNTAFAAVWYQFYTRVFSECNQSFSLAIWFWKHTRVKLVSNGSSCCILYLAT